MKVSVALCTYNGEKYIQQQLESILNQSVSIDQIIVCDDNSADRTVEIVKEVLKNSNVSYRIEVNQQALGVSKNFLKALKLSDGDYVFTCDQDDIWHTDKVKIFLEQAEKTKKDLYFSNGVLVDGEGKSIGCTLWDAYRLDRKEMFEKPLIEILIRTPIVTGAAMMVTRKLIDSIDEIPDNILHDEWFSIIASLADSAQPIDVTTFYYRQHGKNVVGANKRKFKERIDTWLGDYSNLDKIRNKFYHRSQNIEKAAQNSQYQELCTNARVFWETLNTRFGNNRIKKIFVASKMFFKGDYRRFYTSTRGFIRDIICALAFNR